MVANTADARVEAAKEGSGLQCRRSRPTTAPDNGVLGVLPASSLTQAPAQASPHAQTMAYADPAPRAQPPVMQQNEAAKPSAPAVVRTGWIVQVGALESEGEAKQRIDLGPHQGQRPAQQGRSFHRDRRLQGQRTLYRARFAGLERDQAEAVCKTLKRADISCMTVRN